MVFVLMYKLSRLNIRKLRLSEQPRLSFWTTVSSALVVACTPADHIFLSNKFVVVMVFNGKYLLFGKEPF